MPWGDDQIVAAARRRRITVSEIAEMIGRTHGAALGKAIRLVDAGRLIDHGGELSAAPTKWDQAGAPPGQTRLWRVCHMLAEKSHEWTIAQAARLAEVKQRYAEDYFRWLDKQGHLIARRRPGRETIYRLHPSAPPEGAPPRLRNTAMREWRRRQKEPRK